MPSISPVRIALWALSAVLALFAGGALLSRERDFGQWYFVAILFVLPLMAFVFAAWPARGLASLQPRAAILATTLVSVLDLLMLLLMPEAKYRYLLVVAVPIVVWLLCARRILIAAGPSRPLSFDQAFRRVPAASAVVLGSALVIASLFLRVTAGGPGLTIFHKDARWLSSEAVDAGRYGFRASVVDHLGQAVYVFALLLALISLGAVLFSHASLRRQPARLLDITITLVFAYAAADVYCGWCNLALSNSPRALDWLNFVLWIALWSAPVIFVVRHRSRLALDSAVLSFVIALYGPMFLLGNMLATLLLDPDGLVRAPGFVAFNVGVALLWCGRAMVAVEAGQEAAPEKAVAVAAG